MTNSQRLSIIELQRRLHKIETLEDLTYSKSYITSVLNRLDRDNNFSTQLEDLLVKETPLDEIKKWASFNMAQAGHLNQNQVYRFIRKYYLDQEKDINEPFSSFYNKYAEGKEIPYTKQAVSRFLTVLGIKAKNKKYKSKICAYLNIKWQEIDNAFSNLGI